VGEQFASGGSPEVHGAWSHAGHQVPTTGSVQLEQVLIPCSGLDNGVVTGLPMVQEFPHPQVQSVDRTTVATHSHPVVTTCQAAQDTSEIKAVFDASAKSSSGVSLNDLLLVGPTVHSPLIDVLLRF
jgi:hypothetical protein